MDGISFAGVPESAINNAVGGQAPHPGNALEAAQQFEALLMSQILRSERESGSGWLGSGEDTAQDSAIDFAEQQLALLLARQGGLGLAGLIASGLQPQPAPES